MSTQTRPPHTTAQPPADDVDFSLAEIPRRIYAFFYNKKFGLFLILLLGALTLLGTLFPQLPDALRDDSDARAAWLTSLRPRYRGLTDPLAFVGVFTMFSSWLFRLTTIALALSILACTAHRVPNLWKQATRPHTHVKPAFFTHARLRHDITCEQPPAAVAERLRTHLGRVGFRTLSDPHGDSTSLYADRFRWAPFGTVVAHMAFIVILLGVLLTGSYGYRDNDFTVPVGGQAEVGHGTGLTVVAKDFIDEYQPDGRPKDYASDIVLLHNGQQVATKTIRVNSPLSYAGVNFNQASYGLAAQLTIARPDGTSQTETVPLSYQTEDGSQVYGTFKLRDTNVDVYVIAPASGMTSRTIGPGQVQVELYAPGSKQTMVSRVLTQGKPQQLTDLTVTFDRESRYTGLMVSKDPGAPVIWLGAGLLMLGICMSMFFKNHRLWIQIDPAGSGSRVRVASPDRHDSVFERRVHDLVASLRPAKESVDA